ncbi:MULTISPECIES: phage holin family protein [Citricoccus]|uniref:phage holin family protein n=1 Tax=Citricoccus TaxID=169133 RepID=UPI000255EDE2
MTTDPSQYGPTSAGGAAGAAPGPGTGTAGTGRPASGSGSTEAPMPEAEYRARTETLGEMFASFSENLSTLVRQEIQLAKAEATVEAKKAGTGAGLLAGAALAAVFVLLFLSTALMWALGSVMHLGWAALIVTVLWGVAAAVLGVMGKKYFDRIKGLPQTQETVQEIPATLNPNKETP